MAVTARFSADFQSFHAAVDKAEAQLVDFSKGANKVEGALNRMVDNFSGRKTIQEAVLMEKAIAQLGGVSVLTGNQLQVAGVKASEALELMRKRGIAVPPELQKIADKATSVSGSMSGMLGSVSKLAGAFGIAFSVGAVVGFGKSVLASADALVKMSDKTGIGIQGLQRMQVAGDDAGNSIEEMTAAVNQMQNRMASNDPSFLNALKALKVNVESFRALKPEDQFIAMSDALRQIDDPARQVALAMDVFGRAGASVLPTLKRGFDDVKDAAVGMSEETARKLDSLGDSIGRFARQAKGQLAEAAVSLIEFTNAGRLLAEGREIERAIKALEKMRDTAKGLAQPGGLKLIDVNEHLEITKTEQAMTALASATRDAAKAEQDAQKAFGEFLNTFDALELSVPKVTGKVLDFNLALGRLGLQTSIPQLTDGLSQMGKVIPVAFNFVTPIRNTRLLVDAVADLPPVLILATEDFRKFREETDKLKLEAHAKQLNKIGGIFGDVGDILDQVGGKFGELGRIAANTGEQIFSKIARQDYFGAVISGIVGIGAALKGAFRDEEAEKVNDMRDDFVTMSGGLHGLNVRAQAAGLTLDRLLKTDNVKAYTKEVERLKDAFDFQNDALNELADTEEKYHLSLDKASASLFREYQTLISAGHGADEVLQAMQGSWQDLVDDALKFGTVVPESLKPMIQRLLELGLLTDADGKALTDISQIKFGAVGDSFTDAFSKMTSGIDKLVAVIKQSLHIALTDVEKDLLGISAAISNLPARVPWWQGNNSPAPASASASAMLTPGAVQRLGSGSGGGGAVHVTINHTIQAIDSESVAQWLRNGGADQMAEELVTKIPGVLSRHGLIKAA